PGPLRRPSWSCQGRRGRRKTKGVADIVAEVEALDGFWNRHTAEAEQCGHDILGVYGGLELAGLCAERFWQANQERDTNRFVVWFLLFLHTVRAKHVAVIGGEQDDGVAVQAGLLQSR